MKVMVLGAAGMAGHVVTRYLKEVGHTVVTVTHTRKYDDSSYTIDVYRDLERLRDVISFECPDVVVNCIGLLVQASEKEHEKAVFINSFLPHWLSSLNGIKLIHLSTDCVFSGKQSDFRIQPQYFETTKPNAEDFYGRSKALGEVIDDRNCTIRTSIIGPELKRGVGLFDWFMRQSGEVNGYTNAIWNGVTTLELAKFIDKVIREDIKGLVHICCSPEVSKYQMLKEFAEVYEKTDVVVRPYEMPETIAKIVRITRQDVTYSPKSVRDLLVDQKNWY